jgi:hypothetical protein
MTLDTEIGVSVRWPQEFTQPALVAVMQPTDLWERDDRAYVVVDGARAALPTSTMARDTTSLAGSSARGEHAIDPVYAGHRR